jgi:hypothetical protein
VLFNRPEVVVRYIAAAPTRLRCEASSTSFAPALYATQQSCGFRDTACIQAPGAAGTAELTLMLEQDAETFLVIDNGREGGKYTLTCEEQ